MAIRKRKGRASPYQVYWNNPFTKKRESVSFATLAESRKHDSLIQHRLEFERESFRPEENEDDADELSVSRVIALYIAAKNFDARNLRNTLDHNKHVVEFMGRQPADKLEKKDLLAFVRSQEVRGVKNITAHRRLAILRAALAWAVDEGLLSINPLHGIKIPKGQPERIAPPTPEEVSRILGVALPHLCRVVYLGIHLGVRVGQTELFRLSWKDVDLERGSIRVWSAKKNLNRPYRDIPLRTSFIEMLKEWQQEDSGLQADTIVHFEGVPVKSIKRTWKSALEKAQITRRIRPYDLRHAFATYALDAGADLKSVADIMGHADVAMVLKHYQHTKEATRRATVESIPEITPHVPNKCAQEEKGLPN